MTNCFRKLNQFKIKSKCRPNVFISTFAWWYSRQLASFELIKSRLLRSETRPIGDRETERVELQTGRFFHRPAEQLDGCLSSILPCLQFRSLPLHHYRILLPSRAYWLDGVFVFVFLPTCRRCVNPRLRRPVSRSHDCFPSFFIDGTARHDTRPDVEVKRARLLTLKNHTFNISKLY